MIGNTFDYKPGADLAIQRKDIKNDNLEVVFPGATGKIKLGDLLSDEGGEGKVYRLKSIKSTELEDDLSNVFVAKIYLDVETANSKKSKILAMLDMLHNFIGDEALNNVCWPYYAIYDGSMFIGFIMPRATGKTLANLFYPDILDEFPQYSRKELIDICQNIIGKIEQLHAHKIIIGDINEDNFIINSPVEIYFIDTDSYQLEKYPCKVERLEYKAPELIENDDSKLTLKTEGYSTAVLIFKILMLGKHPFSCKNVDEYTVEDRILKGLFPYSIDKTITDKLAPLGFYSFIWNDFSKDLKMFFINIFTRAEDIESVKDIAKYLKEYRNDIFDYNKTSLVPVEFKAYFEKLKLAEEESKKQAELARLKAIEDKKKAEEAKKLAKQQKEEKANNKVNKTSNTATSNKNSYASKIMTQFKEKGIKKHGNDENKCIEALKIFNNILNGQISTKYSSHGCEISIAVLGISGKAGMKTRDESYKACRYQLIADFYHKFKHLK